MILLKTIPCDHNAGQYENIIFWKYDKFQFFGNNPSKLKFRP